MDKRRNEFMIFFLGILVASCASTRNIAENASDWVYFQDNPDALVSDYVDLEFQECQSDFDKEVAMTELKDKRYAVLGHFEKNGMYMIVVRAVYPATGGKYSVKWCKKDKTITVDYCVLTSSKKLYKTGLLLIVEELPSDVYTIYTAVR